MPIDFDKIYQKVLDAQVVHSKFLSATEKNLSHYFFGKEVPLIQKFTFPQIDLITTLSTYSPEAYNPISYFIDAFIDEITNSDFVISVRPYPVYGKEPYESFADQLEDYLTEIHRISQRKKLLRAIVFSILSHGYFGLYTNGKEYWFLSAYDLFPGDRAIPDKEKQPFWVRKTYIRRADLEKIPGIDLGREEMQGVNMLSELDSVVLLDTWVKSLDLNVCFTGAGQVLYHQRFPYPKIYPFFVGSDTQIMGSFYSRPLLSLLRPLLTKYQKSIENIEESAKSIANPILTYDADAGIDVNALQAALKEGYKRIIVGKNREGQIGFIAPGHLPTYALNVPSLILDQMMKHLGITEAFLGRPTAGIRERGAIGRLIRTSFRRLGSTVAIVENTFSELDNYLLEYLQAHQLRFKAQTRFKNIEEIFQDGVRYIATERFKGFGTEDTFEERSLTLTKWKTRLIPQDEALRELGYAQPDRLMDKMAEETAKQQELAVSLKQKLSEQPQSLIELVSDRLKGKLRYRFYLMPIADDKVLVRCYEDEQKLVGFILSDLSEKVMVEPIRRRVRPSPAQMEVGIAPVPRQPLPSTEETTTPAPPAPPVVETRGRPRKRPVSPGEAVKATLKELVAKEKKPAEERASTPPFSEDRIRELVARSKLLKRPEKWWNLPGLYIVEPHARWISTGKKTALLKARKFNIVDQPLLLCGRNLVYGVIIVRDIIEDFDVETTRKFHMVSPAEMERWWFKPAREKGLPKPKLYLYLFEFHPFEMPLEYERPEGVQTFIQEGKVKIKAKEIGLPFKGDLKPVSISPWKIPPPHKPEKRAFQPQEVFSIDRLAEIIPEASYDVSGKIDGLRCFLWVHNKEARMFSDVGTRFADERVKPLLEEALKIFKHDALVDGELVMTGIERKDIAGYVHGKWKPTPGQLASLRYICWDILYVKDRSIAGLPFSKRSAVLDLYLPYKRYQKKIIQRVEHYVAEKREDVIKMIKKVKTHEGAVIRDINASYWATHSTFKMKFMFDVDARVIAIEKTKVGLPIFHCELRDGTYVGQTYAQAEVKAKPGEVIRVNVEHVTLRPDGSVGWYAPRPKSWKEGKITPKKISTTQVGIGGPDTLDLLKEIYLASGGTIEKWNKWYPVHLDWKKNIMPKLVDRLKEKIKAGVAAAKT